jgi:hypothetical protein
MKTKLLLIFLLSIKFCFSQSDKDILGSWEFSHCSDSLNSKVNCSVKPFIMTLNENKSFTIKGIKDTIVGSWELTDSTLVFKGKKNQSKNTTVKQLKIISLDKKLLKFNLPNESEEKKKMILVKK